jgi:hypothetical protein
MAVSARRDIKTAEEVSSQLRKLADELGRRGEEAEQTARDAGRTIRIIPNKPDPGGRWVDEVRRVLEDEIVVAPHAFGDEEIEPLERDREIAKKALAGLKLEQLKRIAEDAFVDPRGREEQVIDRIVAAYKINLGEIARLVLENEEVRPDRGIYDRLFPTMGRQQAVGDAFSTLEGLVGRYVRTGIARWIVFDEVDPRPTGLRVRATFRSYSADAVIEDDLFEINAVPHTAFVSIQLRNDTDFIRVRSKGVTEARQAVIALSKTLGFDRAPGLPLYTYVPEGRVMTWDPRSALMVELLSTYLDRDGLEILNLTAAQFQSTEPGRDSILRPEVRAVRLDGAHLLSSKPACELLVEGRALTGISLLVRFNPTGQEDRVFSIRVNLQRDYITVFTGLDNRATQAAEDLQRTLVDRVERLFENGISDPARLNRLAEDIYERARHEDPVEKADILAPAQEWVVEESDSDL